MPFEYPADQLYCCPECGRILPFDLFYSVDGVMLCESCYYEYLQGLEEEQE